MPKTATNLPVQGRNVETGTVKSLTSNYISTSDDGKKHKIKNVPYVIVTDMPDGNIIKSYYDYVYTYLSNVVFTDYRHIPYMRHLDKSLDSYLFDIDVDIDKIRDNIRKKFNNSSLELLDVDVNINRELRQITITCRLEYKGIILTAELLRKVSDKEKTVIQNIQF